MNRFVGLVAAVAIALLLGGMVLNAAAAVIVGASLLAAIVVLIFVMAWRTKGWSFRNLDEPDDAAHQKARRGP